MKYICIVLSLIVLHTILCGKSRFLSRRSRFVVTPKLEKLASRRSKEIIDNKDIYQKGGVAKNPNYRKTQKKIKWLDPVMHNNLNTLSMSNQLTKNQIKRVVI
jgi:hypothetical protein